MFIEKRKNSFRAVIMRNKKKYSVTFNYKPTKTEATIALEKLMNDDTITVNDSFEKCCNSYISSKTNTLSPNTIRTYYRYKKSIPYDFNNIPLSKINNIILQNLINDYAKSHQPKTTKCFYGFINSVIQMYSNKKFKIVLPQLIKKNYYIPTFEDVQNVISHSEYPYKIVFALASYGLRIGEIRALTMNDIFDDYIDINKSISYGVGYEKFIKAPKTFESTRKIKVSKELINEIRTHGLYCPCEKRCMTVLYRIQDKLNIPHFSLHKFRHFFASYLHSKNVPDKTIQKLGGWATNNIMLSVYTHSYSDDIDIPIKL